MSKFGFRTLTFLVVANMIGAGVFTTSGFSLADLGSPLAVVLAWAVGGLIAVAGAYSYGMLARAMPESGGEYLFLSRAAHPILGFIAGWVSLIAGFSGAIAFAATAFESYAIPEGARPPWLPSGSLAVAVIVLAGIFHGLHPRIGAATQNAVVALKLGLLAAILLFAAICLPAGTWHGVSAEPTNMGAWAFISAFAGSLVWISLSYSGFNAAVYVAGEAKEARVSVPKALVAGTLLVMVLYILLNAVFVYAPPAESIRGMKDVAAIAAKSLGGEGFATFVRCTVAVALLTSVLSMMMAAPRVYAKMADDGLMPGFLRFRGNSPWAATAVQVILAVFLVLVSTLQGLLSYLGLTLSLSAACSVSCLFLPSIRRSGPTPHPIRLIPPFFYIVCTITAAVLMTISNPLQLLGTALTFSVGALVYVMIRYFSPASKQKVPETADNRSES